MNLIVDSREPENILERWTEEGDNGYLVILHKSPPFIKKLNKSARGRLREDGTMNFIDSVKSLFNNCSYELKFKVYGTCDNGHKFEMLDSENHEELGYPEYLGITDINIWVVPKVIAPNGRIYGCKINWMQSIEEVKQFKKDLENKILKKPSIKYLEVKWFKELDCPLQNMEGFERVTKK